MIFKYDCPRNIYGIVVVFETGAEFSAIHLFSGFHVVDTEIYMQA